MTRLAAARLAVLLTLLVGMLGCDLSPPLLPLGTASSPSPGATATPDPGAASPTPSPTPSPSPTPAIRAIRGYVVDRNDRRLPGARVTLGNLSVLTAEASASATDELGQVVSLEAGEFILLNVLSGDQTLTLAYDDVTHPFPLLVSAAGVTRASQSLPVDGAVPSGSKALVASAGMSLLKVQKASASASLVFMTETVTLNFKAPPNGSGDQIGAYSLTYVQAGEASLSETVTRPLPQPISVAPALGATRSGPQVPGEFHVLDTSAGLQSAWTFAKPDATLKLEFFHTEGGRPILDRDGKPLVKRIPCTLIP